MTLFPLFLNQESVSAISQGNWKGRANRLSRDNPIPWEIIDDVTQASWKSSQESDSLFSTAFHFSPFSGQRSRQKGEYERTHRRPQPLAGQIIHQRRSAVSFDGKTSLAARPIFSYAEPGYPSGPCTHQFNASMPWDAISWPPTIHLALFVHRVDGIPPGLYMLIRSPEPEKLDEFKSTMHEQFQWIKPKAAPPTFPYTC